MLIMLFLFGWQTRKTETGEGHSIFSNISILTFILAWGREEKNRKKECARYKSSLTVIYSFIIKMIKEMLFP